MNTSRLGGLPRARLALFAALVAALVGAAPWTASPAAADEPVRTIVSGQTLYGAIDFAYDYDSVCFDGAVGQRATIRMTRTGGGLDPYVYLYAPNGALVAKNDDGAGYPNSLISSASLGSTGRYRISAAAYGATTGSYKLSLTLTGDEPARWISSGQTLSGVVNFAYDYDSIYFDALAGQWVTIRENKVSASLDPLVKLYSPAGALVAQNDDGGGSLNSLIYRYLCRQDGRYRIAATAYGSTTGSYTVSLVKEASVIKRGTTARKVVALTFDAGSDRGNAESILNTLRSKGVRASFGMLGEWAQANPDLIRRMAAEGHTLINHTQTHQSWTGLSDGKGGLTYDQRLAELRTAESSIAAAGGPSPRPYFRPPYGEYDGAALRLLADADYSQLVMWTVDSNGWRGWSAAQIRDHCLSNASWGAIYIFHVGAKSQDASALGAIIDGLRAQGYSFETVPQIVR